jgi:hypothetical protein
MIMNDTETSPTLHTCAVSGAASAGKHYVLTTTEGTELVCPEALFHTGADLRLATLIVELQERVRELEERLEVKGDTAQADAEPVEPVPAKKAPAQRKAAD